MSKALDEPWEENKKLKIEVDSLGSQLITSVLVPINCNL